MANRWEYECGMMNLKLSGGVEHLIFLGGMKNLKRLGESENFETFEGK